MEAMQVIKGSDKLVLVIVFLFIFQLPGMYWPLYLLSTASFVRFWRLGCVRRDVLAELYFVMTLFFLFRLLTAMQIASVLDLFKGIVNGLHYVIIYMVIVVYSSISVRNSRHLLFVATVALCVSVIVYVACLIWPSELYQLKGFLYPEATRQFESTGLSESSVYAFFWASGLSPYLHLFGYQLAALLGMALSYFVAGGVNRFIGVVLIFFVSLVSVVAAQRSVLAAGSLSLLFGVSYATMFVPIRGAFLRSILLIFLVAAIGYVVFEVGFGGDIADLPNLFDRFDPENVGERGGMQIAALKIIANKPFGLIADFKDELFWGVEAMKLGYSVAIDPATNSYALVHNSYLRFPLELGWLAFLVVGFVCFRVLIGCGEILRRSVDRERLVPGSVVISLAISGAILALSVQALFHNDSILTFEATSLVLIATMFGLRIALKNSGASYE